MSLNLGALFKNAERPAPKKEVLATQRKFRVFGLDLEVFRGPDPTFHPRSRLAPPPATGLARPGVSSVDAATEDIARASDGYGGPIV